MTKLIVGGTRLYDAYKKSHAVVPGYQSIYDIAGSNQSEAVSVLAMSQTFLKLSPPWDTLWKKFVNTFGCDPAVTVGDLDTSQPTLYVIPIVVDDEKKGTALATVIRSKFPMGNITVVTAVKNSKGQVWAPIIIHDEDETVAVFKAALTGNSLFVDAIKRSDVFIIMTKSIVQFFNDNSMDYYGNLNSVTAQVLSELIWPQYANNKITCLTSTAKTA